MAKKKAPAKRNTNPKRKSRAAKPKSRRTAAKAAKKHVKKPVRKAARQSAQRKPATKSKRSLKPAPKKSLPPATRIIAPKEPKVKKLVLVFLGPPGVGKGTQAAKLAAALKVPHISTGDLFRDHMKRETPLGLKAKEFVNAGKLVPDEVTVGLVEDRLQKGDCGQGFIFDGFPRTVGQDIELAKVLTRRGESIAAAMYFNAPADIIVERISGRRTCRQCGAISHAKFNPTRVEGKCDLCGGETYQRSDDAADKVSKRLEEYAANTGPLVERYRGQGLLREIDGTRGVDEIFAAMSEIVTRLQ
jgi:adenylate kinase